LLRLVALVGRLGCPVIVVGDRGPGGRTQFGHLADAAIILLLEGDGLAHLGLGGLDLLLLDDHFFDGQGGVDDAEQLTALHGVAHVQFAPLDLPPHHDSRSGAQVVL
jgi:hypothetical protein